jgi:hypothetical protein
MKLIEKEEWVEDLWNRTLPPGNNAVAVCLLDYGVNRRHKLIEKGLDSSDLDTCDPNSELVMSQYTWYSNGRTNSIF